MSYNVGGNDKLVRILLSMVIIGAGFYFQSWLGMLAVIPLFTALFSLCPAYTLMGISTCHGDDCDSW